MTAQHPTKKRILTGTIVSDAMQKTRVVAINREKKHPKYQRYYQVTTRFKVHDEKNEYHTGDTVMIAETRPLSRHKRWIIIGRVKEMKNVNIKMENESSKSQNDE